MINNVNRQLRRINNEDLIWGVYFFIVIAALFSNAYERKFVVNKDKDAEKKYKTINVCIFTVSIFIYLYFASLLYEDLSTLRNNISKKRVLTLNIKLIAAILFIIGGIIYLIFEIDQNEDAETGII
ncbi:MAG: hypothetical protein IJA94_01455 [Bacilli bacterium]|nr:hypothetical protein [Bacilli bacterium]